jgi:hypothetical protein
VDLPELTPQDAALLAQFRVDETPSADTLDRMHRRLRARISHEEATPSLVSRWTLWLRAGGLSVAIAAVVLLILAGGSRLLGRAAMVPTAASDSLRATPSGGVVDATPPPVVASPDVAIPPTLASPELPTPAAPALTPALDSTRGRSPGRTAKPDAATLPKPIDAAAEIALLSAARRERDPRARLELIARHHREFAGGKLVQEFAVIEIQTLCALGRTDDGRARAQAFAQHHPGSAYAAIAARACEESAR